MPQIHLNRLRKPWQINSKKRRKRVQASHGEVLTTPEVAERLLQENTGREEKKKENPDKVQKQLDFEEPEESEGDESDDETECQKCKTTVV